MRTLTKHYVFRAHAHLLWTLAKSRGSYSSAGWRIRPAGPMAKATQQRVRTRFLASPSVRDDTGSRLVFT